MSSRVISSRLFSPTGPLLDEVEHGQPVDDDEVLPAGFPNALHDRHREPHSVLVAPAPLVLPGIEKKQEKKPPKRPTKAARESREKDRKIQLSPTDKTRRACYVLCTVGGC